jgi:hypothetical protein
MPNDPRGNNPETDRNENQPVRQDVDKAPGEGRTQNDQVTEKDLKGKKVDADPSVKSDQPAEG